MGTNVASTGLAVAADDEGRAVIAWSQLVSGAPAYREQAVAAIRQAGELAFGSVVPLGRPWRAARPPPAPLGLGARANVVGGAARHGGPDGRPGGPGRH